MVDRWAKLRAELRQDYQLPEEKLDIASTHEPKKAIFETTYFDALPSPRGLLDPHDPKIGDLRYIEKNLEEASHLLGTCDAARLVYEATAEKYQEAQLRLAEFFASDAIHQLEVDAGLYRLELEDVSRELEERTAEAGRLKTSADRLAAFRTSGAVSRPKLDEYREANAALAGATTQVNAEEAKKQTKVILDNRNLVEIEQWQRTAEAEESIAARVTSTVQTLTARKSYLEKDVGFKTARTGIARELAHLRFNSFVEAGGPLNYAERLAGERIVANLYYQTLLDRCVTAERGLRTIYGLAPEIVGPNPTLDRLKGWLHHARVLLAGRRSRERLVPYTLDIGKGIGSLRQALIDGLVINVSIDRFGPGLLRAIDMDSGEEALDASIVVQTPAVSDLRFPRVLPVRDGPGHRYSEVLWNTSAVGAWKFRGKVPSGTQKLFLTVWLATT